MPRLPKISEAPVTCGLKYAHLLGELYRGCKGPYLQPYPMEYQDPLFLLLDSENWVGK